jgi:flagellar motility protein MotE (MotC chaperone)
MMRNNKLIFLLAVYFLFSGLMGVGYKDKDLFEGVVPSAFAEDKDEKKAAEPSTAQAEGDAPCPECPECPDPAKIVLRGLEDKKLLIEKSQKELAREKKELERYEEQIDEKLLALEALKKQINADMASLEQKKTQQELEREAAYEAKIQRLVKMYAGMKPKNAALIVDKMTLEVAQEIFLRMREASAAQILAFVDSGKAAKISERLAYKKKQ